MILFNKEDILARLFWKQIKNLESKQMIKYKSKNQTNGKLKLLNKWLREIGEFSAKIIKFTLKVEESLTQYGNGIKHHN